MRRALPLVVVAIITAALVFPLAVIASHQFTDVPNSNVFHADIDAVADSGVTTGCGPTTYCPNSNVTRGQMAAFMNRLGALGPGKTPVVNADKVDGLNGSQFVRSDTASLGQSNCPGAAFLAAEATTDWGTTTDGQRILDSGAAAWFYCRLELPQGATITNFVASFYDNTAAGRGNCHLRRFALDSLADDTMASTSDTGLVPVPGVIVSGDATVDFDVVANESFTYLAHCYLEGATANLRLISVKAFFTLTGHPVW